MTDWTLAQVIQDVSGIIEEIGRLENNIEELKEEIEKKNFFIQNLINTCKNPEYRKFNDMIIFTDTIIKIAQEVLK
jgi:hypothetical protein